MQEIGRVIVRLNQRRGFKSDRKADRGDAEDGEIASASAAPKREIEGAATEELSAYD